MVAPARSYSPMSDDTDTQSCSSTQSRSVLVHRDRLSLLNDVRRRLSSSSSSTSTEPPTTPFGTGAPSSINTATPNNTSGPMCRICHEGEQAESLTSPCMCSGSVGLVHISCLEHWLTASNKNSCELCHHRFDTNRFPRPLLDWIRSSDPGVQRSLTGDSLCFLTLTPLAAITGYFCIRGANQQASQEKTWEAICLMLLSLLLTSVYLVWVYMTIRFHYRSWMEWRSNHPYVKLVLRRPMEGVDNPLSTVTDSPARAPDQTVSSLTSQGNMQLSLSGMSSPVGNVYPIGYVVEREFGGLSDGYNLWA